MKNLVVTLGLFLASAQCARADDPGICYIYVSATAPCAGAMAAGPQAAAYYTINAFFRDSDPMGNLNAGRCIERAREYLNWCNQAGPQKAIGSDGGSSDGGASTGSVAWVATYYQVNGANRVAAYTYPNGQTVLTDAVSRWLNITLVPNQPK